jgi:hypothetical protein
MASIQYHRCDPTLSLARIGICGVQAGTAWKEGVEGVQESLCFTGLAGLGLLDGVGVRLHGMSQHMLMQRPADMKAGPGSVPA